jgi:hypothetical protein
MADWLGVDMENATPTWRQYLHLLTPEQIRFLEGWSDPDWWEEYALSRIIYGTDGVQDAHRRRLIALARDRYGAMGPGRLN